MKKYVFLGASTVGIGGGHFYVSAKLKFLENDGWIVYIYSGMEGDVIIPGLKRHKLLFQKIELAYSLRDFAHRKREKFISEIANEIGDADEIIIESAYLAVAGWGELLAERLKGKHIIYTIAEQNTIYSEYYYNFYNFKLQRKEIAGIRINSLKIMFSPYRMLSDLESYYLLAFGGEMAQEYTVPIIDSIEKADINIGIVSRIDKPFVSIAVDDVVKLANGHTDLSVNLLILGCQPGEKLSRPFEDRIKNSKNIKIYVLEMMTPIPKSFYRKVDVVISSSGCARISSLENVPTIAIDANDFKPIGILGYTTLENIFREKDCEYSTIELLEKILFQDFCNGKTCLIRKAFSEERYQKQMEFIRNSEQKKEYFDLSHPHRKIFDFKCLIKRWFGVRLIAKLKKGCFAWKF